VLHDKPPTNTCQKFVWDSLADMRLIRMREEGYTYPRIADLLGVPSEKICRNRYAKLRPRDEPLHYITQGRPYSDTEIEEFKAFYLQRDPVISMSDIGLKMGRSKNSMCSLRRRLNLPSRPRIAERGVRNPYGSPAHNKRADGRPRAPRKADDQSGFTAAITKLNTASEEGFPRGGKTFIELGSRDCRFISGDPRVGDHKFCGAPSVEGKSWCSHHYKVVYRDDVRKI